MGKCCLHASLFIFDWIFIKVAGDQDRHKSLVEFDFGTNQTTHFGVTCPWVTKISHFWTWISLKPVGQSWQNFMCSIIGVGERLHKVLGQIDLGTLDSGERSLPFGLLVVQGRISKSINGSKLIFQLRVYLYVRPAGIYKSHDLYFMVCWLRNLARLSRLRFLSKLIFYMKMYLYESSSSIQEPLPHDLYFTICWLWT